MYARDYPAHELVCAKRRLYREARFTVPMIGGKPSRVSEEIGISADGWDHYMEVMNELRRCLARWNVNDLRRALLAAIGPSHPRYAQKKCKCSSCILPDVLVGPIEARLHRLEEKARVVAPISKKGLIIVDYENDTVRIERPINFAKRKQPDTSAELEPGGAAEAYRTLRDLAVVLNAYMEDMVVQGHTGGEEPREYWQALAFNRAKLIVSLLEEEGVPPGILEARGEPGGGTKVVLFPKQDEQQDEP